MFGIRNFCLSLQSRFTVIGQATLAQSVEQRIRNAQVGSSSLLSGSEQKAGFAACFFVYRAQHGMISKLLKTSEFGLMMC